MLCGRDALSAGAGERDSSLASTGSSSCRCAACGATRTTTARARSRIPRAVVERAWQRELAASGDREGRFFHLIHDGGVWQAYGFDNGTVRGVYCPSHNSQRAAALARGDLLRRRRRVRDPARGLSGEIAPRRERPGRRRPCAAGGYDQPLDARSRNDADAERRRGPRATDARRPGAEVERGVGARRLLPL